MKSYIYQSNSLADCVVFFASLLPIVFALCLSKISFASEIPGTENQSSLPGSYEFYIGIGNRLDHLRWHEGSGSVNIASELKWENLHSTQLSVAALASLTDNWALSGKLGVARIADGRNQDSDYNGDNRTLEYSRSNNRAGGELMDVALGIGKRFSPDSTENNNTYAWTPMFGYSLHQQRLTMTDGYQTIPASGPYPGLDSVYAARWHGPWLGLSGTANPGNNWAVTAQINYHFLEYQAQANWNLRTDFAHPLSFEHRARGSGISLDMHAAYTLHASWQFIFGIAYTSMRTRPGNDKTYFADGSTADYPLNEVAWEAAAINLGISSRF